MKNAFTNDLSKEIFDLTYSFQNETLEEMFQRVAKNLASIEKDPELWEEKFKEILDNFKFVPGGRILSNAGLGLKGTSYINCFVDGFIGEDQDSMSSIMDATKRQAMILKSEGGYGFCADTMRPRGALISGIAAEGPGAVAQLEIWDTVSRVITKGSEKQIVSTKAKKKIRKGAMMVTMSCWHPDIEEFITAKQTPGMLTKFNMSVLITDDFMHAVKKHLPWKLEFPDFDANFDSSAKWVENKKFAGFTVKELYKQFWKGDIKKWKEQGLPITTYKEYKDANELWDLIMKSTYNRNEPGVLFVDTINRLNNLWYEEYINATNPCGEQVLPIGGVCLLGSINLTQYLTIHPVLNVPMWDYEKLEHDIPIIVRMMDNVNDLTNVPLESQKENLQYKRRIGLGILGYGSSLLMMNVRYGSEEALKLTNELMEFIANTAYQSSALLAKEKGLFPLYDETKYLQSKFVQNLSEETKSTIKKYGIRNSHLLSIQPTGNTSIFANNVSGGLEPVFLFEYIRTFMIPFPPQDLNVPTEIDWKTGHHKGNWSIEKEGDEVILATTLNGVRYKFDQNRGLTKEALVEDYGVNYLKSVGRFNRAVDWAVNASNLTINDHVETMKVFSKWIDSAMSKTINLVNDFSFEDFKDVYMKLFDSGTIKGGTTYREGTMATVLAPKEKKPSRNGNYIIKTNAPKRPKTLPCEVHHATVQGHEWVVFVGLLSGEPYEVFALKRKNITLPAKIKSGSLTKIKSGTYRFETEDGWILESLTELFELGEEEALTRTLSWGLRHGGSIKFAIEQLNKSEGTVVSFGKAIARTLKKYVSDEELPADSKCPECHERALTYQEGCLKCTNCGWSQC